MKPWVWSSNHPSPGRGDRKSTGANPLSPHPGLDSFLFVSPTACAVGYFLPSLRDFTSFARPISRAPRHQNRDGQVPVRAGNPASASFVSSSASFFATGARVRTAGARAKFASAGCILAGALFLLITAVFKRPVRVFKRAVGLFR